MNNQEQLGLTAAELMDTLEKEFQADDTVRIVETIIIVRIEGVDEGDGWSVIQWRASDPVWSHQLGLMEGALEGMRNHRLKHYWRGLFGEDENDDGDDTPL